MYDPSFICAIPQFFSDIAPRAYHLIFPDKITGFWQKAAGGNKTASISKLI